MSDIKSKVMTRDDLSQMREVLDTLSDNLFKSDSTLEADLTGTAPMYEKVLETLKYDGANLQNISEVTTALKKYKQELDELEEVHIVLSFEPSRAFIEQVYDYLKEKLPEAFYLSLQCNPTILGGVQITFRGQYQDLSLSKRLTSLLEGDATYVGTLLTQKL